MYTYLLEINLLIYKASMFMLHMQSPTDSSQGIETLTSSKSTSIADKKSIDKFVFKDDYLFFSISDKCPASNLHKNLIFFRLRFRCI